MEDHDFPGSPSQYRFPHVDIGAYAFHKEALRFIIPHQIIILTENRKYHFVAELTLKRSHVLDEQSQPEDDKVNWLFLNAGELQFSFVYKIETLLEAKYDKPFKAELAFTMIEAVIKAIKLHHPYQVLRGQELIGTVRLINAWSNDSWTKYINLIFIPVQIIKLNTNIY